MADSNTAILDALLMETNSHTNDWGTQLNANFGIIDRAAGIQSSAVVHTGGVVVRTKNQLVEFIQRITGVLTSNATIEVPAALTRANLWINDTTGNFTMVVKVNGQTGITLLRGDSKILRCNGADVVDAGMPTYSQLAGIAEWMGDATGTNAYTVPANQYVEVITDGLQINAFILNGNTGAVSLNFANSGFKSVVHSDGSVLASGAIPANSLKTFTYHLTTDKWYMGEVSASTLTQSAVPSSLVDAATIAWDMATTRNNVTVALTADRAMGTPTNQAIGRTGYLEFVQPAGGGCSVIFPAEFDPMGTPRLDETVSARTVFGYFVRAVNAIQLWPLYMSGKNSVGFYREFDVGAFSSGPLSVAHGLGGYPALIQAYVECITPDGGFAVGDRLLIGDLKDAENERGFNVGYNATNVIFRIGDNNPMLITTGGNNISMVKTSWKLVARVYE